LEDYNLGTELEPRYVKLSKALSEERKIEYHKLFCEFFVVFVWKYEDLNTYDTVIIQNRIPLKYGTKPFRKKLRQLNPLSLPMMEK